MMNWEKRLNCRNRLPNWKRDKEWKKHSLSKCLAWTYLNQIHNRKGSILVKDLRNLHHTRRMEVVGILVVIISMILISVMWLDRKRKEKPTVEAMMTSNSISEVMEGSKFNKSNKNNNLVQVVAVIWWIFSEALSSLHQVILYSSNSQVIMPLTFLMVAEKQAVY